MRTQEARVHGHARIFALALVLVMMGSLAVVGAGDAQANASASSVTRVGTLDRMPADAIKLFGSRIVNEGYFAPIGSTEHNASPFADRTGTLLLFPEVRQLWQLFPFYEGNDPHTAIAVRDPDTLAIKHSFVLNTFVDRAGSSSGGGSWHHAVDGDRRVFLAAGSGVISVDFRTFARREYAIQVSGLPLGGMAYDPFGQRVVLAYSVLKGTAIANVTTFLYSIDANTGNVVGPRPLRSCNAPLPSTEGNRTTAFSPYIPNRQFVYMPCQRSGYSGTVVRIPWDGLMDPASAEEMAVGPVNLEAALVDHGSGRMFLTTILGEIWAFDVQTMAFVGVVGSNADGATISDVSFGLDPTTGRLIFMSPTFGLGIVDGRFFPIPQARTARELAERAHEHIPIDPSTNKAFVLTGWSASKAFAYTIYRIPAAAVPPPPPDPDANTTDQPEKKGVTEARYNASASGYGVRALMANGVATVPPAPGVGDLAPTAEVLARNLRTPCGFTDRELIAARVHKTETDTGSTAAQAIAVDVDPRTQVDLDQPSRCDVKGKDNNGSEVFKGIFNTAPAAAPLINNDDPQKPRWNHTAAVCSSSSVDTRGSDAEGKHPDGFDLGPSEVHCPLPGGKVWGRAETKLAGVISVGKVLAETEITRDDKGIHSVAKGYASDIQIGDGIHIAEIRSVAESHSNGRPRGKGQLSKHHISISGVRILGETVCGVCNPAEVVDVLNRALAGRAQFRMGLGTADARLIEGSPRGALTGVQKSPERQVSDQALVGDFTTEVAALELIVYNDNNKWGRARQLYQFAGVSTSATYNIVGVPFGSGLIDPDLGGDLGEGGLDAVGGIIDDMPVELDPKEISLGDEGGDGIFDKLRRAVEALGRGVRLFFTSPRHALLLLTGWALFLSPIYLYRRRLTLAGLD